MEKVVLEGYIKVPEKALRDILAALPSHIKQTKLEPGCLTFEVTQRHSEPCYFDVYETFVDEQAFEHHQARVKASSWGEVSKNAERHYQIKKVKT
ncbi:putative quinol monooxygenase [Marinomonas epiphytica]